MIVDRLAGIVVVILLPDQVQNHFIGVHTSGVLDEQRENIKFLDRQRDYLAPHSDKALLQAEVQITFPDFRQGLVRRVLLFLKKGEGDINRNIASLIITNKLSQLLLLAGRKQSK